MKYFVLILTLIVFQPSLLAQEVITIIEAKQINIKNQEVDKKSELEHYIAPFREKINSDLDKPLATCPETLDKSKGIWQTNIGDFMAELVLSKSNFVFEKRENKKIDICILNHGGIRAIMPQGDVSARNAYEIMPFDNSAVVLELKGEQIIEFINYFIAEKKPHPIAGLTFTITPKKIAKNVKINNVNIVLDKVYYVATNDYLANGGDKMDFFKKALNTHNTDYKLRNMLIDYLNEVDTIEVKKIIKVTQE